MPKNQAAIDKLIVALRTKKVGDLEIEQGFGKLNPRRNQFCCLGVACLIAEQDGINCDNAYEVLVKTGETLNIAWRTSGTILNEASRKYFGFRTKEGSIDGMHCLTEYNDVSGKTFNEIADIIESSPEGLFEEEEVA